jgi:hypothetical protein
MDTSNHEHRRSVSDIARKRSASRDLIPGLTILIVSQMSLISLDPDASDGALNLAWALSPLVGIALLVWAQARILARSDERERAQELSAMAIGFAVVVSALAAAGVLQSADLGDARQQMQITTGLGIATWVAASLVVKRRTS